MILFIKLEQELKNDSIHSIGNRLIHDSTTECVKLIKHFDKLKRYKKNNLKGRLYNNKDFSEESIKRPTLILSKNSKLS